MRHVRFGMGVVGLAVLVFVFLGFLRLLIPGKPSEALHPEIRGVVVAQDFWDGQVGRFTLDTGAVVGLNVDDQPGLPKTPRLSKRPLVFDHDPRIVSRGSNKNRSSLVLVGHDGRGRTWYASATELGTATCPFEIYGDVVFDEGDHLLFGSGLVLPKSFDFELLPTWAVEREDMDVGLPLGASDRICIDRYANALNATVWMDY